ncbi:hypothetical protein MRB53_036902 [Persea americana]|nr:hypothetical protein MRB53_036902 [Persea americana]
MIAMLVLDEKIALCLCDTPPDAHQAETPPNKSNRVARLGIGAMRSSTRACRKLLRRRAFPCCNNSHALSISCRVHQLPIDLCIMGVALCLLSMSMLAAIPPANTRCVFAGMRTSKTSSSMVMECFTRASDKTNLSACVCTDDVELRDRITQSRLHADCSCIVKSFRGIEQHALS